MFSLRNAVALLMVLAITFFPISLPAQSGAISTAFADADVEGFDPLPESPMARARREGNALPLSLAEAVEMARENSLFYDHQEAAAVGLVQQSYWTLALAISQYEIKRNSANRLRENLRDSRMKLESGNIPNIEVAMAENAVVSAELHVVAAEKSILEAQNNLRQTMSSGGDTEVLEKFIAPVDPIYVIEFKIDSNTEIAAALRNRSEIETGNSIIPDDVTIALRSLEDSRLLLVEAMRAQELAKTRYENEQKRYDAELAQNYLLLDSLNALTNSELLELQAAINYKLEVAAFERLINALP